MKTGKPCNGSMNVRDRHVSYDDRTTEAFVRDTSQLSRSLDRDRQNHFGCSTILSTKPPASALLSTTPPRAPVFPPPGTFYLSRVQHSQQLFPVSSPPVVSSSSSSSTQAPSPASQVVFPPLGVKRKRLEPVAADSGRSVQHSASSSHVQRDSERPHDERADDGQQRTHDVSQDKEDIDYEHADGDEEDPLSSSPTVKTPEIGAPSQQEIQEQVSVTSSKRATSPRAGDAVECVGVAGLPPMSALNSLMKRSTCKALTLFSSCNYYLMKRSTCKAPQAMCKLHTLYNTRCMMPLTSTPKA